MLVDLNVDNINETIAYLRESIEFENAILPRDGKGNPIPAVDSPVYRRVKKAEDIISYWEGIMNDRRKNGFRMQP